jgi:pyrroline-5-carboxylate reductase
MSGLVFLGGGRITSALVAGLRRAGLGGKIVVHDRHPEKLRRLAREFGVTLEANLTRAMAVPGLLVIAVQPAAVRELLARIDEIRQPSGHHRRQSRAARPIVAVSLAAGVPLATLRRYLGPRAQWTRAMPSPVCSACRGLTALTFDRSVPPRTRRMILQLFAQVGGVVEIPEKQFDAFTVTYSSSHGLHALATLAGAAEKAGLPRKLALTAAAHALADGIAAWREHPAPLAALIAEAATPGGTAAAVMAAMDARGYPRIVERALQAGIARARHSAKSRA